MDLLQHFEDVDGVRFLSATLMLLAILRDVLLGLSGFLYLLDNTHQCHSPLHSLSLPKLLFSVRACLPATAPQLLIFVYPNVHIHTGIAYGFALVITCLHTLIVSALYRIYGKVYQPQTTQLNLLILANTCAFSSRNLKITPLEVTNFTQPLKSHLAARQRPRNPPLVSQKTQESRSAALA